MLEDSESEDFDELCLGTVEEHTNVGSPAETEAYKVDSAKLLECLGDRSGMVGFDRAHVERIVQQMSEGSSFYRHEKERTQRLQTTIDDLLKRKRFYENTSSDFRKLTRKDAETKLDRYRPAIDFKPHPLQPELWVGSCYVHIDMDMFYCACEMQRDPTLTEKPMAVGGAGMLCTSNYPARKFGIRAGMPGFIAQKLCKDLIVVRPDFPLYKLKSEIFMGVCAEYDAKFQSRGMDEVSLDLTEWAAGKTFQMIEDKVRVIRTAVQEQTGGLTCSAGIGCTRILAKIKSNDNKPDGQTMLKPSASMEALASLKVGKVPNIGKTRAEQLTAIGLETCRDIWARPDLITYLYTPITAENILALSCGVLNESYKDRQSVGCERTFGATDDCIEVVNRLRRIAVTLAGDLTKLNKRAKKLTFKVKDHKFQTRSITETLATPTASPDNIFNVGVRLFRTHLTQLVKNPHSLPTLAQMTRVITQSEPIDEDGDDEMYSKHRHPTYMRPLPTKVRLIGLQASQLVDPDGWEEEKPLVAFLSNRPSVKKADAEAVIVSPAWDLMSAESAARADAATSQQIGSPVEIALEPATRSATVKKGGGDLRGWLAQPSGVSKKTIRSTARPLSEKLTEAKPLDKLLIKRPPVPRKACDYRKPSTMDNFVRPKKPRLDLDTEMVIELSD